MQCETNTLNESFIQVIARPVSIWLEKVDLYLVEVIMHMSMLPNNAASIKTKKRIVPRQDVTERLAELDGN